MLPNTISPQNLQTTQGVRLFRLHEKMQTAPGSGLPTHVISMVETEGIHGYNVLLGDRNRPSQPPDISTLLCEQRCQPR
jgi:hypothetical protein